MPSIPILIVRISRCSSTFSLDSSREYSVSGPLLWINYAASAGCRSCNQSTSSTVFAVRIPKKMYRISVIFIFALICRIA